MKGRIGLVTILTDNIPSMKEFYGEVLGFEVKEDLGNYVEFVNKGVRFALCTRNVMHEGTGHSSYKKLGVGQAFELAFPLIKGGDPCQGAGDDALGAEDGFLRGSRWEHPRALLPQAWGAGVASAGCEALGGPGLATLFPDADYVDALLLSLAVVGHQ
jgi:catechol 2,3-dioxygenase-like lactoylglutathione lyase family enzyme